MPSRTVLVTGGTNGIGRAVSPCLAKAGHGVFIVGRDAGRAAQVLDELHRLGARGNHGFVAGDLSLLSDRIKTDVFGNAVGLPAWARALAPVAQRIAGLKPELAAQTPVYLATDTGAASSCGRFFGPRCREKKVPESARRPERRAALWAASDALVCEHL